MADLKYLSMSWLRFSQQYSFWRGGGVLIPGAKPGALAQLFVCGDPVGFATVGHDGRAQFFRGSPVLPTTGASVFVSQPGLLLAVLYDGVEAPVLPGRHSVPVYVHSQWPQLRVAPPFNNEILYMDGGSSAVRRFGCDSRFTARL